MKDSIVMTKSTGLVFTLGQTSESIRVCGSAENSMASVSMQCPELNQSMAFGKMASVLSGSILKQHTLS